MQIEERFLDPRIEKARTVYEAPSIAAALELARNGRVEEAIARLEADLDRNPRDLETASAVWSIATDADRARDVAPRMVVPLEVSARTGDDGLPRLCWGEMLRTHPNAAFSTATAARIAEMILEAGHVEDTVATLRWLEGRFDDSTPVGQLVRLARMADRLGILARFAELALTRSGLPREVEEELRELFSR
jgi:hypothetical protein